MVKKRNSDEIDFTFDSNNKKGCCCYDRIGWELKIHFFLDGTR